MEVQSYTPAKYKSAIDRDILLQRAFQFSPKLTKVFRKKQKGEELPVWRVALPVTYICGTGDTEIMCGGDYALQTQKMVQGRYNYTEVQCADDLMGDSCSECGTVLDGIVYNIESSFWNRRSL